MSNVYIMHKFLGGSSKQFGVLERESADVDVVTYVVVVQAAR